MIKIVNIALSSWMIVSSADFALCQQIIPDNTLGSDNSVISPNAIINNSSDLITGGARRESNLFHSFKEFNVSDAQNVYFDNPAGVERIIARVTGNSASEILGRLGVYGGNADLFLLNPNGIIFGPNASLDLKGSFLATSAGSLKFPDAQYSAIEPDKFPLLTISSPIGFQFRDKSGTISNLSQVTNNSGEKVGLQVEPGKTLTLLGGDITIEGGRLTAPDGRIEVGSLSGPGKVSLKAIDRGWELGYGDSLSYGNIQLFQNSVISSEGSGTGDIQFQGGNITITDQSKFFGIRSLGSTPGSGGTLRITASDTFTLGAGSFLTTDTVGEGDAGNIVIVAEKVFLRDGAFISSSSTDTRLPEETIVATGNAGNVSITSKELEVSGGASIRAFTIGEGKGGNITINSTDFVKISGTDSSLFASTQPSNELVSSGGAGNIKINTQFLQILDGGRVFANSSGKGTAGNIDIFARSVLLENQGFISAQTRGGEGNITFHEANDIILRNNSSITTNATDSANGGNILINTGVLLALPPTGSDGSDIVAKADKGRGGNIVISAKGIFGIEKRIEEPGNRTNDIDASSQFGRSGQVDINTAIDPNNGLTELPETVVDPDTRVAQSPCNRGWGNELTVSGRGGLPPSPSQDLSSEATQVKLVEPVQASNETQNNPGTQEKTSSLNSVPEAVIAPARGWVYNKKGQVVLVAYDSTITGAQRLKVSPAGCPVP